MSCGSEAVLSNTVKEAWLNEYPNKYKKLHLKGQVLILIFFSDINLEGFHSFYCRFVLTDVRTESDQEFVYDRPFKYKEYLVK